MLLFVLLQSADCTLHTYYCRLGTIPLSLGISVLCEYLIEVMVIIFPCEDADRGEVNLNYIFQTYKTLENTV